MSVKKSAFGTTATGVEVDLYTITNAKGESVALSNYGATWVSAVVLDQAGELTDVVLGYNDVKDYEEASPYFGSTIGRVGNRIGDGGFSIDGTFYPLKDNNFPNDLGCHLHGGEGGFATRVWTLEAQTEDSVTFSLVSEDGDQGYPGRVQTKVSYTWTVHSELNINYWAQTDAKTPLNMTNHVYLNLKGEGQGDIMSHELEIPADRVVATDHGQIARGNFIDVEGTPFDFRVAKPMGQGIDDDIPDLRAGEGFDHTWVLKGSGDALQLAAKVSEATSGRHLEVWTTEPGSHFYAGNGLGEDEREGKSGVKPLPRGGFCLETQHFPNSPNVDTFPSIILAPGETYETQTSFRFSANPR